MKRETRLRWGALAAPLLVFLLVRLLLWGWIAAADPQRFWDKGDTPSYDAPARALLELGAFRRSPDKPDAPELSRTPGYPLFLAFSYATLGRDFPGPVLLQILLAAATLLLVARIAEKRFGPRVGVGAAWLYGFDPLSLAFCLQMLTETLFTLLLVAAALAGMRSLGEANSRNRWAPFSGGLVALATLVRPIAYYLILPLSFALALGRIRRAGLQTALVSACLCWIVHAALVGGWIVHNYVVADTATLSEVQHEALSYHARWMSRVEGLTVDRQADPGITDLLRRPVPLAWVFAATTVGVFAGPAEHRLIRLLGYDKPDAPGLDLMRSWRQLARGHEPRSVVSGYLRKWIWPPHWALAVFLLAACYLAAVHAGWLWSVSSILWRKDVRYEDVLLWSIVAYLLFVSNPTSRFRVPIMPFLCVYAAAGLWRRSDP